MNRIFLVITAICLGFSATAQLPVLVSECLWWTYNNTQPLTPSDSIVYSHSNGRNSVAPTIGGEENGMTVVASANNLNPLQKDGIYMFDSCQHYGYAAPAWITTFPVYQTFGLNGLVSKVLYKWYDSASSSWKDVKRSEYVYGAGNTLDTNTYYNYNTTTASLTPNTRDVYFYNTGKKQVAHHYSYWSVSSWSTPSTDSFWYNTAGDAIRYKSWGPGIPNTTNEFNHYEFGYNASHRLVADTQYVNAVLSSYETYQYNTNGTLASSHYYDSWGSTWQEHFKIEYHYDTNNNLAYYTNYKWDVPTSSFIANGQKTYTYNNFNQLTSSNDGTYWRKYYYGPAPVTVPSVEQNDSVLLYPVPATSYINLELHTATPQNLSISITDMGGRTIKQWTEANVQHYKKFIPVMDIAPGNYTLQVIGKETISKTFSVIR